MAKKYTLAIDQGTTSSRAILFDSDFRMSGIAQKEFQQYFPKDGWVEHDPEEIWASTLNSCIEVLKRNLISAEDIEAIGITNQRETTIIWDKETGRPIYNAIVWQDRRTTPLCESLKSDGLESLVSKKTGLVLDPYFSATKIRWILDNVEGARVRAKKGKLLFGTVDSFLLWRLTGGASHKTDVTNASRTMLFNIHSQSWDPELLSLFDIPPSVLPTVHDCVHNFGFSKKEVFSRPIPVLGIAGDQHAALVGQSCFKPGMMKSTFGTGCFMMLNTGSEAVRSENKLLTTVAYRIDGQIKYGLEGSIFVAGAAVQWLRDKANLIPAAEQTEAMASRASPDHGLFFIPAFTGLGAPYWDPNARGALFGVTRDTSSDDIVRATLESVSFQCRDLMECMTRDGAFLTKLRVDGGMVNNNWLVQNLADVLQLNIDKPSVIETTALGAAYFAAIGANLVSGLDEIGERWELDRQFSPSILPERADEMYLGWVDAVKRILAR
ncbi:glycerol kinase GlpK [Gammaproteobacteria bacterium]|nr:glycerol kinase GlpK [Gammaproteobacteria bacterium]